MNNVIKKYGDPFVAVFIDLTAAYDHIPREKGFPVQGVGDPYWSNDPNKHT